MRIGLMGGSFDPIHTAHINIAQAAQKALALDRVIFIPTGNPPHKDKLAAKEMRYLMVRAAIMPYVDMFISDDEIIRRGLIYTIDTIANIKRRFKTAELFFLIGADTLFHIETWKDFNKIARMVKIAALTRKGVDNSAAEQKAKELAHEYCACLYNIKIQGMEISSTEIREMLAAGISPGEMLPGRTEEFIRKHGLYGSQR